MERRCIALQKNKECRAFIIRAQGPPVLLLPASPVFFGPSGECSEVGITVPRMTLSACGMRAADRKWRRGGDKNTCRGVRVNGYYQVECNYFPGNS